MLRLRKRAVGLLLGAGLLFFLGVNVQAGWLFVLAALLLGTVIAGLVLAIGTVRGLEIDRDVPPRVHQGDEAFVDLVVHGPNSGTRRGVVLTDDLFQRVDLWIGDVRPGERVSLGTVRVARRRGPQPDVDVRLSSAAPFGIAERRRQLHLSADVLVLPRIEPLRALPFIEPTATAHVAMHTEARRGQGPEYLGIREYRAGDSMRHVHWGSTARTGTIMVREFEQEQTRRLAIVLDASRDLGDTWTPLDRVCCAAGSIAMAAFAHGHGTRLVTAGGDHGEVLTRLDEDELLERLAHLNTDGREAFPSVVRATTDRLRGVDTAVLVFPTWPTNDADHLPQMVQAMAERVPHVVAVPVVVDTTSRNALNEPALAGLVQRLRALGVAVYPWRDGEELAVALGQARVLP